LHYIIKRKKKERIEALNGKVEFEGNESFTIKGFLPIGGSEVD